MNCTTDSILVSIKLTVNTISLTSGRYKYQANVISVNQRRRCAAFGTVLRTHTVVAVAERYRLFGLPSAVTQMSAVSVFNAAERDSATSLIVELTNF